MYIPLYSASYPAYQIIGGGGKILCLLPSQTFCLHQFAKTRHRPWWYSQTLPSKNGRVAPCLHLAQGPRIRKSVLGGRCQSRDHQWRHLSTWISFRKTVVVTMTMSTHGNSCAQTAEATEILFGVRTCGGPGYHVSDGSADHPKGRGNFGGEVSRLLAVYSNFGLRRRYSSLTSKVLWQLIT